MDVQRIAPIANEIEANLLDAVLTGEDIPHIMQTNYDLAYDGIFQRSEGWGWVQAPPEHAEHILTLLANIRAQQNAETA